MELLVKKFSNGKYENEGGELFAEQISEEIVKRMDEMIALQSYARLKNMILCKYFEV